MLAKHLHLLKAFCNWTDNSYNSAIRHLHLLYAATQSHVQKQNRLLGWAQGLQPSL